MYSLLYILLSYLATSDAASQGFNYGSTKSDGLTVRVQSDFQTLFRNAKSLPGTAGFTSARLYTTIQGGTASDTTSAIPAAIAEHTTLLLGLWASAGQPIMNNEIIALKAAISKYGNSFTDLVVGISVGSEDLYRNSPLGIAAKSGYGAEPNAVAEYMKQVRSALVGTKLSSTPIGHVDTWTAWVNGSNQAVIDASDWIGMDAYPYFQNTQANSIDNGAALFNEAMSNTRNAVKAKPIWITETGWPVSGSRSGAAETGTTNAKIFWDKVGCPNFGSVNTWWFTLDDTDIAYPDPSFGVASGTTPKFDLSCSNAHSVSIPDSISISQTNLTNPVVSTGSPLSPTVENGIGNYSNSGAAPSSISGTSTFVTGRTLPSASNIVPNMVPYPPVNVAPVLSGSMLITAGLLLISFFL